MPSYLISDNMLITYEVLESLSTRVKGKQIFMALKLDMSKVYDIFEWDFTNVVMLKMGFYCQ